VADFNQGLKQGHVFALPRPFMSSSTTLVTLDLELYEGRILVDEVRSVWHFWPTVSIRITTTWGDGPGGFWPFRSLPHSYSQLTHALFAKEACDT
jgi:hypothetical protein